MSGKETSRVRVRVLREKCAGHARCFSVAPDIYVLDDEGYNVTPETIVPAERAAAARAGAEACPECAILVEDVD